MACGWSASSGTSRTASRPVEQAREILKAQIAPVAAPLVSAVPAGTMLRALFLTESGEAYVDLSRDVATRTRADR